jgi:large subunit ribosomal protein L4
MTTVNVQTPSGDVAGTVDLPPALFDVEVNIPLVHQVVVAQLAAARQGTSSTKTRGEVRGGGRKPYRQKGTGRARQGSTRAPQFVGGGVVHGPTPRSYAQRTPKKMKAAALRSALSDRARGDKVHVVSALLEGDVPSTKLASATLAKVASSRHVLVVLERSDALNWKSLRNAPTVHLIAPDQLNTYDVLISDDVVFTEGALAAFIAGGQPASHASTEAAEAALTPVDQEKPAAKQAAAKTAAAPAKKAAAKKAAAADTESATEAGKPAAKKAPAKKAAAKKATEPAAGVTAPAGEDVSDDDAVAEVAEQTSSDRKAEDVFEREADGATTETAADDATADEVSE